MEFVKDYVDLDIDCIHSCTKRCISSGKFRPQRSNAKVGRCTHV